VRCGTLGKYNGEDRVQKALSIQQRTKPNEKFLPTLAVSRNRNGQKAKEYYYANALEKKHSQISITHVCVISNFGP
jgi:hypothetical protein